MGDDMNLASWADHHIERFGEIDVVTAGDRTWTNTALRDHAARMASALIAAGVAPGDRVLVALPASPELLVAATAVWRAGGVLVMAYVDSPAHELARIVAHCRPTAIVAAPGIALPGPISVTVDGNDGLDRWIASHAPLLAPVPRTGSDLAQLCYTTGTTGAAKAVRYTCRGIDAQFRSVQARHTGDNVELIVLPPTAFGGFPLTSWAAARTRLVLLESFEPGEVLSAIEQQRVTRMRLVPAMVRMLLAVPATARRDLSSMRELRISGAQVPPTMAAAVDQLLGVPAATVTYGMTEAGGGITIASAGGNRGSVGRPLPGVDVEITDDSGRPVPAGATGQVRVRTPWMADGYEADPERTTATFVDGWIITGDRGFIDAGGDLFLIGRSDGIIIQAGVNVAPDEIADILLAMPEVVDAAVIGLADDLLGEQVVACVVLRAGADVDDAAILAHCRAAIDPRKTPRRVVRFERLPRTAAGKVATPELRSQALERAQAADRARENTVASDGTDARIAAIWADVLGVNGVVAGDDFFALGGHSLIATQLATRVRDELGVAIPLRLIFEHPTLGEFSRHVLAVRAGGGDAFAAFAHVPAGSGRQAGRCSPVQERWYHIREQHMGQRGGPPFSGTRDLTLTGPVDPQALADSLAAISRHHPSLRTSFRASGQQVHQTVLDPSAVVPLALHDLRGREQAVADIVRDLYEAPLDVDAGQVFRAALLRLGDECHRLVITSDHLVNDVSAFETWLIDLFAVYAASRSEPRAAPESVLGAPGPRYLDWAAHQWRLIASAPGAALAAYWTERLAGAPDLMLAGWRPSEAELGPVIARDRQLPDDVIASLDRLARQEHTTRPIILLALLFALAHRSSGQRDLCIAVPTDSRPAGFARVVGWFTAPLLIRVRLESTATLRDLCRQVRAAWLEAYERRWLPIYALFTPPRGLWRLAFNYQNRTAADRLRGGDDLHIEDTQQRHTAAARLDLDIQLVATSPAHDQLRLQLVARADRFDAGVIQELLADYEQCLADIVAAPDSPAGLTSAAP